MWDWTSAGTGAASGAGTGASFGPWGALVGALLGGATGGMGGGYAKEMQKKQQMMNQGSMLGRGGMQTNDQQMVNPYQSQTPSYNTDYQAPVSPMMMNYLSLLGGGKKGLGL